MCGIVGYHDMQGRGKAIPTTVLDRMTDALSHRGPDGRGVWQQGGVAFGHRRLAIIDLSELGAQPMLSHDQKLVITFNGEIYNYQELRKELEQLGHRFKSHSDTEVILESYRRWGRNCVERFNGIFAFALWDEAQQRLWLARDPLGVKPLFYSDCDGAFLFASEIPALLECPWIPRSPDYLGLDTFFSFGYTAAPRTGFSAIKQLLPGQTLTIEQGKLYFKKYWDFNLSIEKLKGTREELTLEFERKLENAVHRQMVADVPLGAFLSSGVDSFAVVRAMQKLNRGQTKTFSIGFREKSFDELPQTRLAAQALDVDLYSEYFQRDCTALLNQVARHCLEPMADSSSLPMYLLCQLTAKKVKVALSGDGGDELLAGYPTYSASGYARMFRTIPAFLREGLIRPLAQVIPQTGYRYSFKEKVDRFMYGAMQGRWRDHASWRLIFQREFKKKIYSKSFWHAVKDFDPLDEYAEPIRRAKASGREDLDALLYADLTYYLPNDMLVKVDRMSMAHGLEVRVPFLDKELVEFAWRLPTTLKARGKNRKVILRSVIRDLYPPALQKLGKRGFNTPDLIREETLKLHSSITAKDMLDVSEVNTAKIDRYQYYALKLLNCFAMHLGNTPSPSQGDHPRPENILR